jgi:hypothetical protein
MEQANRGTEDSVRDGCRTTAAPKQLALLGLRSLDANFRGQKSRLRKLTVVDGCLGTLNVAAQPLYLMRNVQQSRHGARRLGGYKLTGRAF